MKRWLTFASVVCFAFAAGCKPERVPDVDPNAPVATTLPERDGIPSDGESRRLLYYVSSHADGPGLYAYLPSTPNEHPTLIDADLNIVSPFTRSVPSGNIDADGTISDLHVGGVFYKTYFQSNRPGAAGGDTFSGRAHLSTTQPSQLQSPTRRITNDETSPSVISSYGGVFSFNLNDMFRSSFVTKNSGNEAIRCTFNQGAEEPALLLPRGRLLFAFADEDNAQNEHWLYANDGGELVFYDRDFTNSTAIFDEDTNMPLADISKLSTVVTSLTAEDLLVVIATNVQDNNNDDTDPLGTLYRVSRPSEAFPGGSAKILRNTDGETLEYCVAACGQGLPVPTDPMLYVLDGAAHILDGAGTIIVPIGVRLTRADRDGWTVFSYVKAREAQGLETDGWDLMLAAVETPLFDVPGYGAFWSPGLKPELIEPSSADGLSWKRTAIGAPTPFGTEIFGSTNGWLYYEYAFEHYSGAIAYHVPTNNTLTFPDAAWVGASSNGSGNTHSAQGPAATELAELFLLLDDGRLAALEASDPEQGMVIVGTVPKNHKELNLLGLGRSPHRLLQLIHEDDSVEVLYVDTRSKGSLKHLMESPAERWQRPMVGGTFDGMKEVVDPRATSPVELF